MKDTYYINGIVKKGYNYGEKLGAKTANLDVNLAKDLPKGLHACRVLVGNNRYNGLLYYGFNSLTNVDCLEVHILEFDQEIYGKKIEVEIIGYIRKPKKFKTGVLLQQQIQEDLEKAKIFFKKPVL